MLNPLRHLPQIQSLLDRPALAEVIARFSHEECVAALRAMIDGLRDRLKEDASFELPDFDGTAFAADVAAQIEASRRPSLRPVINATGILIHTNLGRAPLAAEAIHAMQRAAAAPTALEFDLGSGKRGSRHAHVESLLCALTGAEAAVVVNNCAAAVLLGLMATATGRSVVASRGELIEIGGSFRLPDVIAQSGATLREVGATNKTRLGDYAAAIDEDTAVLLKSHTSNFKIVGFTSVPDRRALAELAREKEVILMEDLGSGVLIDLAPFGLVDEPVVADILKAGVDLVMFSGDKLLGGPQAGIIAGRQDIIARLKSHPLMRAVRIDKLSLAALEATLRLYCPPFDPMRQVPVLRMLSDPIEVVQAKADHLAQALNALGSTDTCVFETAAQVGGGSLPEQDLASVAVSLSVPGLSPDQLAAALRRAATPIIGRITQGKTVLDMRTVNSADVPLIAETMAQIAPG